MVPTGFVIKDYLEEIDLNQKEFAKRMGMSEKHISNLLNGKSKLTEEFAIKLEKIIHSVPASYWLNYEAKYREFKVRNELISEIDEATLKLYDKKFNFSSLFSGLGLSLQEQANEMLKLLRISGFVQFDNVYSNLNVDFMEDGGNTESIAIWLNLAREEIEIQNNDLSNKKYTKEALINSLDKFKLLALNPDYRKSIKSARKLLNSLGIYLVLCDAIVNSKVRGALTTYKKKPAIYLSGRFKTHDHIWFALMHEIGHLIQHYLPDESLITLENDGTNKDLSLKEMEANQFSRDFFISNSDYQEFTRSNDFTQDTTEKFAKSQKVHIGIVLGRLQHDGYLPYDKLSYLKNRE